MEKELWIEQFLDRFQGVIEVNNIKNRHVFGELRNYWLTVWKIAEMNMNREPEIWFSPRLLIRSLCQDGTEKSQREAKN
jgi:hypothetical protein